MLPETYIREAVKTESCDEELIIDRMSAWFRMVHAAIGMSNEAGEVLGIVKKVIFYGKHPDKMAMRYRISEEMGDILWYMAIMCDELDLTFEELMEENIEKLRERYDGKAFDAKMVGGDNG